MSKHTPVPWFSLSGGYISASVGPDWYSKLVARTQSAIEEDGRANAAFIVRACNAHDDLLEACKEAAEWLESGANGDAWALAPAKTLRAAIARAEGRA